MKDNYKYQHTTTTGRARTRLHDFPAPPLSMSMRCARHNVHVANVKSTSPRHLSTVLLSADLARPPLAAALPHSPPKKN